MNRIFILLAFFICFSTVGMAQASNMNDSCESFTITIHCKTKNSSKNTIFFWYTDCLTGRNRHVVTFKNGEAFIKGHINYATEVILFTDTSYKFMDGPGVIRFIAEPKAMTLSYSLKGDTVINLKTTGSLAQAEKQNWDRNNDSLFKARNEYERLL